MCLFTYLRSGSENGGGCAPGRDDSATAGYRGTSCTRNRTFRKRTGFEPCVFLISEKGTDRVLPPFSEYKKTSDRPVFLELKKCRDRPGGAPQRALCGGIPSSFLEPSLRSWSHFVGVYRQTLTTSLKNDFEIPPRRALGGTRAWRQR